jgi:hypothetical protein
MREREDMAAVGELVSCIAVYRMRISSERSPVAMRKRVAMQSGGYRKRNGKVVS